MSYSDFTIDDLKQKLELRLIQGESLFSTIAPYTVSTTLNNYITTYKPLALAIDTEKARSEYIIAPLLGELKITHWQQISLFSGIEFNVDKNQGLNGRCDYILSQSDDQYSLTTPIIMLVEAKNDNIKSGIPQCGAEMVAAQIYNERKQHPKELIYGCVSTGTNWKFLKLQQHSLIIDIDEYYIDRPEKIMGILMYMCLG